MLQTQAYFLNALEIQVQTRSSLHPFEGKSSLLGKPTPPKAIFSHARGEALSRDRLTGRSQLSV